MEILIDLGSFPVQPVLARLLEDKTTKRPIMFGTDAYADLGSDLTEKDYITVEKLTGTTQHIKVQPRVSKSAQEQLARIVWALSYG